MDFKPNAILDSMDRAQALACVYRRYGQADSDNNFFVCGGEVWLWVNELLPEYAGSRSNFFPAINAYYDAREAASKPKWVVPEMTLRAYSEMWPVCGGSATPELARTNARRKIEAFIAANGGNGKYSIVVCDGGMRVNGYASTFLGVGEIGCCSVEQGEAVIERYPDELRLLTGGDK